MISEQNGSRKFESITRWNVLDYTYITRKSTNAIYADNYGSSDAKLCLTRFRFNNNYEPYNKYKLVNPVTLTDGVKLCRFCEENGCWLAIDSTNNRVKMYKEVV